MLQKPTLWRMNSAMRFRLVPALMPHFDHARILDELPQQLLQVFAVQAGVLERDGELDEQRAQLAFRGQRVQTFAGKPFVLVIGRMLAAEVGSITASGEWVNDRCSFAVKRKFGLTAAAFRDQKRPSSGRMCP